MREFRLGLIREAVERDVDGINLDFQRHPTFFDHESLMLKAFQEKYGESGLRVPMTDPRWYPITAQFMTTFVREARAILDEEGKKKGRRVGLSVRIDWQKYRTWGCDIETWLKEGWLDYPVVG